VVDPWGKVLADLGEESPSYKIVDIDLGSLNEVRNSMPVLNCARDDLYPCVPLALSLWYLR
jgi:predicted amidohydrolase